MASEMRRVARLLVARREQSFTSRHSREQSIARLAAALGGFAPKRMSYAANWRDVDGAPVLDVVTTPARSTDFTLKSISAVFVLLLAGSAAAILHPRVEGAIAFLLPLCTALSVFAFPFVVVALGSQREAEEVRLAKAIRRALVDEEA
jgi:hypothetical protein